MADAIGPTGNVRTDTANTYTTGAQTFTSATSLIVPNSGGAAPTADMSYARVRTAREAFAVK